ncbi:MAG: hypothetical protein MUE80_03400, partial [Acidobacteria bacterium]|nr:hypothetical protein [Acidobacteriota bacterium]
MTKQAIAVGGLALVLIIASIPAQAPAAATSALHPSTLDLSAARSASDPPAATCSDFKAAITPAATAKLDSCTVIGAGRLATVDGSVITSHSDCCSECRIQVVPGRAFPKGAMADVHWGMVYFGAEDDRRALPLGDFGQVIGRIPQAERTFAYFHTGYSQMN